MNKGQQLEIPLFPEGMMEKIKAAHAQMELQKALDDLKHEKHVRAGYMGAYEKLKKTKC